MRSRWHHQRPAGGPRDHRGGARGARRDADRRDRRRPHAVRQPGAAVSVAAGLARRPDRAARRVGGPRARADAGRRAGARSCAPAGATAASPIRPGSRAGCSAGVLQSHLAVGDDRRRPDLRRRPRLARASARRASPPATSLDALAPSNFPWSNPAVVKETVDQGGLNLVRGARRFAGDFPHLPSTVDTSRFAVGENLARHARLASSCAPRSSSSSSTRRRPRRSARSRCCSRRRRSTSSTCSTSRPGRSMVEWLVAPGPAGVRRSPGATRTPSRATSTSTPTRPRSSRRATPSRRSPGSRAVHLNGGLLGRDHRRRRARAPRRRGPARRGREPDPDGRARSTTSAPGTAAALTGRDDGRGRRRRVGPPRATSTARRWPACSPGCAPTTWSGTTSSTTTCSARSRRPSTSCTGTRTPSGSPPACTATSSASASTTRSSSPARSRCSARPSTSARSTSTATSSPA